MPGLREKQFDVDTTTWTAHDCRRACIWHVIFFIGWSAFFPFALGNLLSEGI
jgi:hypothetical protein